MPSTATLTNADFAVIGDPIAHSRSPILHNAAFLAEARPYRYGSARVSVAEFPDFLANLPQEVRGLSVTMPLKAVAFAAASEHDDASRLTGGSNTLVFDRSGGALSMRAWNTDVPGLAQSLRNYDVSGSPTATILGSGATAASALLSLAEGGTQSVTLVMRNPEKFQKLSDLGAQIGLSTHLRVIGESGEPLSGLVINTIPTENPEPILSMLNPAETQLYDIVYSTWPAPIAAGVRAAGGIIFSGIDMLIEQALIQQQHFLRSEVELDESDLERIRSTMREAVRYADYQ